MLEFKLGQLCHPQVLQLLHEHLDDMQATSPPESKHALDVESLKEPSIRFWTAWDGDTLAGCGAYQKLDEHHAELKSMRTSSKHKNKGVASSLLENLINQARKDGMKRLSLETGSMDYFKPARNFYQKHGFNYCSPFANYTNDPNSRFMYLDI